jgi:hypothetical protein
MVQNAMQYNNECRLSSSDWTLFMEDCRPSRFEHHLFPRSTKAQSPRGKSFGGKKPFCEKWKVRYHEKTFF